jgi:hypothetical protein
MPSGGPQKKKKKMLRLRRRIAFEPEGGGASKMQPNHIYVKFNTQI